LIHIPREYNYSTGTLIVPEKDINNFSGLGSAFMAGPVDSGSIEAILDPYSF
jgi:hypothetical protein